VLLVVLRPDQLAFEDPEHVANPDALSISYLKVLMRSDPSNDSLRVALVKQLLAAGLATQAHEALAPLLKTNRASSLPVQLLSLRVDLTAGKNIALSVIERILQQELNLNDLEQSVGSALAGGKPLIAAKFSENIARKTRAVGDWQRTIDYYVAAGEVSHAANLSARLLRNSNAPKTEQAVAGIRLFLAADKLLGADQLVNTYRQILTETLDGATIAYQVARMSGNRQEQEYWNTRLLEITPDDPTLIDHSINTALANQKFKAAISLIKRQLELKPESTDLLRRLAQLYEWNSQPHEALSIWYQLFTKTNDSQSKIRTLALANATYNYPMIVDLFRQKPLISITPGELDILITNAERSGDPDIAIRYLNRFTEAMPEQQHGWQQLLNLMRRNESLDDELKAWARYQKHHAPNLDESLRHAALLWQMDKAEEGLQKLADLPKEQYGKSAAYWRLRSDMAWYLQLDDEAIDGYNQLLALAGKQNDQIWASKRLLEIALIRQDDPLAALYSELIWRYNNDPDMLLMAMSYAVKQEDTEKFRQLLEENPNLESSLNSKKGKQEYYWGLLANYYQQMDRSDLSLLVWNKILRSNPSNTNAKISLMWVLMDLKYNEILSYHLNAWRNEAIDKQEMWHVIATAYSFLGDCRSALAWYKPLVQNRTVRSVWLLDYARNLDCAGYMTQAEKIAAYYLQQYEQVPLASNERIRDEDNRALRVALGLLKSSSSETDQLRWLANFQPQLLEDKESSKYRKSQKSIPARPEVRP